MLISGQDLNKGVFISYIYLSLTTNRTLRSLDILIKFWPFFSLDVHIKKVRIYKKENVMPVNIEAHWPIKLFDLALVKQPTAAY